jgi:tRNA(fMet)-specific endonuclease VapC
MSGINYFLDTNAIISLLNGNDFIEKQLQPADWIDTSIVYIIEFLSFSSLSANDRALLFTLTNRIHITPPENSFSQVEQIAKLRQETRLKLPDAAIAAQALAYNALLISNDRHFTSIPHLTDISF